MKKLSLLIGGLLFSGLMMAQSNNEKGDITLEGQTNIGGVLIGKKLAPSVRFRYFATEKFALRGTFGLSNKNVTRDNYELPNNNGAKGTYTTNTNVWNLAVGAEYHVPGTDRVSPYIALDLIYGSGKSVIKGENSNANSYIANYKFDAETPMRKFGAALMGGLDYNFSRSFYLGGEIGVQVSSVTNGAGKTTSETNGVPASSASTKSTTKTASDLIAAVRLGFRF